MVNLWSKIIIRPARGRRSTSAIGHRVNSLLFVFRILLERGGYVLPVSQANPRGNTEVAPPVSTMVKIQMRPEKMRLSGAGQNGANGAYALPWSILGPPDANRGLRGHLGCILAMKNS
jgi:hypothetical protein